MFNDSDEGFPWDDLRKILYGGQRVAKVHSGEKTVPKAATLEYGAPTLQTTDGIAIAKTRMSVLQLKCFTRLSRCSVGLCLLNEVLYNFQHLNFHFSKDPSIKTYKLTNNTRASTQAKLFYIPHHKAQL